MTDNENNTLEAIVPNELAGKRLDQALAEMFPDYSRSRIQAWIKNGYVMLDGNPPTQKQKLIGGEWVELEVVTESATSVQPENIPLDVVYEDDHLIIINKPADMVVHPAPGNYSGTIQNALLFHYPKNEILPRSGIVHRLDKETTGLMVVARSLKAHKSLVEQLQARTVTREYLALVFGSVIAGGTVNQSMGRHPVDRKRMAVIKDGGKQAITHYRVAERFKDFTLLRVKLETGRTHQIRVHMEFLKHGIVGDPVYGGRMKLPRGASDVLIDALRGMKRQALHAETLALIHPNTGETMSWSAPIPDDFAAFLEILYDQEFGGMPDDEDDFEDDGGMEVIWVRDDD